MMNQQSGLIVCRSGAASRRGPAAQWYRALVLALLVLPAAHQPARSDDWVRVATGGLGDPARREPDALAVVAGAAYLATHDAARNYVFRAELRNDTVWLDVSPPWRTADGKTAAMVSLDQELWLSTSGGELWRRDRTGRWNHMTPSWASGKSIFALTTWTPPGESAARLVAVREGVELWWRRADGTWVQQGLPDGLRNKPGIVNGALQSFGSRLYLGVGSSASTSVQVWRLPGWPPRWDAVTTAGFGREELTWVNDMIPVGDRLYIGTGGHGDSTAGVFRTQDTVFEDVTPCDLFGGCEGVASRAPVRFGCLEYWAGKLFVGTRSRNAPEGFYRTADVIVSGLDGGWAFSNTEGFGVDGNDTTTGLAAGGSSVYACTFNSLTGFEVWRRNALIVEMLPYLAGLRDSLLHQRTAWLRCVVRPNCRRWETVFGPMEALSLTFDTARNQQDDQQTIMWARQSLTGAVTLLKDAKKLADRADKMKNRKKAALLRNQAAEKVKAAIDTAVEVCRKIGA
ncbi:MAG: hypothetical protein AB1714_23725 [Acidobacteriota bacterium]